MKNFSAVSDENVEVTFVTFFFYLSPFYAHILLRSVASKFLKILLSVAPFS